MGRIIAIDYGSVRCGIAESDDLKIIASPLTTVENKELPSFLENYLSKYDVETIVLGYPLTLRGDKNTITTAIEKFAKKLKNKYPSVNIEFVDEFYTSKMAEESIRKSGAKKKKRQDKGLVDKIAAVIILQDYLKQGSIF